MAFCPGCGYEFSEGLRRCLDCDLDLVASLEEVDGTGGGALRGKTVSVFTSTRAAVEMLADLLNQEGIPSMVKPASASSPADAPAPSPSPAAELHVAAQDAEDQQELIQELIAEIAGADNVEP